MAIRYNTADDSLNGVLTAPSSHDRGKSSVTIKMILVSNILTAIISIIISVAVTLPLSRTYIMGHTSLQPGSQNLQIFQGNVLILPIM